MKKRAKKDAVQKVEETNYFCPYCQHTWWTDKPSERGVCDRCTRLKDANLQILNPDSIVAWAEELWAHVPANDQPCNYAATLIGGLCAAIEARLSRLPRPMTDDEVHEAIRQHVLIEH